MKLLPIRSVRVDTNVDALAGLMRAWDSLYKQAHATLLKRIKEFGIPEVASIPLQDQVVIYRLPAHGKETKLEYTRNDGTPGVIHFPDVAQDVVIPYSVGVLIFAGAEAGDVLESHGTLPGDFVRFARFAGEEEDVAGRVRDAIERAKKKGATQDQADEVARQTRDAEQNKKKLLTMQVPFVHESVDLLDRLYGDKPTMEMVREVDAKGNVERRIRPII